MKDVYVCCFFVFWGYCFIGIFFVSLQFFLWEVLFVDSSACMEGSGAAFN